MTEQGGFGAGGIDRLLSSTMAALEQVRAAKPAADVPDVEARGEAADGKVVAVAVAGGKIKELTVEPRLLRDGLDVVTGHIVTAVNAALDELRRSSAAAAADTAGIAAGVDTAALAGQLREVQDSSMRQMEAFAQSISDVMSRLPGRS